MNITEERHGAAVIMKLHGRLDSSTAGALEEKLLALLNSGITQFVLNFSGLDYISSAGLRVVLMVAKKLKPSGGRLALCELKDHIREVFDLAGFSPLFPMYDSQEAALKSLPA